MPTSPLRPCATPRCPLLVRKGHCEQHAKAKQQQADTQRGSAQARGYDSTWAAFSKRWREMYPVCGMRAGFAMDATHSRCWQAWRHTVIDLVTDHIVPLAHGGEKYDEANLETLCRACNSAKDSGWRVRS